MTTKIENVLEDGIGFVELIDSLGGDLTIINSARVSFGKQKTELDDADKNLINYLAKNKHWSPFRHIQLQFRIKAPEIVGRQFYKHIIGADYTFKDHAWNEISGRYIVFGDEFYHPKRFRKQSESNKQASTDEEVTDSMAAKEIYDAALGQAFDCYKKLIDLGVCKEQARGVLPVSFYTEWYWTASLQAVMNFIKLREDNHAQWEIKQFATAIKKVALTVAPIGVQALLNYM
jgi:thymidylate synthase (FAD)